MQVRVLVRQFDYEILGEVAKRYGGLEDVCNVGEDPDTFDVVYRVGSTVQAERFSRAAERLSGVIVIENAEKQ
jgi:hypothetical protein